MNNKIQVWIFAHTLDDLDPLTRRQAIKMFNSKIWQEKTVQELLESTKMKFSPEEKIILTIKNTKGKPGAMTVDLAKLP